MQTKVVELKNGSRVILYLNETTGEWLANKDKATDDFHAAVMNGTSKQARTIRKYYSESTIQYTREKIRSMVNKDLKNIDLLYDTIVNEILNNR